MVRRYWQTRASGFQLWTTWSQHSLPRSFAGVELEAASLVGAELGGFEPHLAEALGGGGVAPVGGADVLEAEDHRGWSLR